MVCVMVCVCVCVCVLPPRRNVVCCSLLCMSQMHGDHAVLHLIALRLFDLAAVVSVNSTLGTVLAPHGVLVYRMLVAPHAMAISRMCDTFVRCVLFPPSETADVRAWLIRASATRLPGRDRAAHPRKARL
jgi:hypothetical protein